MLCIFCLQNRPPSNEDVFPLAIGGGLITNRVCIDCNSLLGAKADAPLCNHLGIIAKRSKFKLAGQSRKAPDAISHFVKTGKATLASDPTRNVRVRWNPKTGKLDVKLSTRIRERPDGNAEILLDASNPDVARQQLFKLIQRHRRRSGMVPLAPKELVQQVEAVWESRRLEAIENPQLLHNIPIDSQSYRRGIFKIAYELAATWLGDRYVVDDAVAAVIRDFVLAKKEGEAGLRGTINFGSSADHPLALWRRDRHCHVAMSTVTNNTIVVAIKIFDAIEAVVVVSEQPEKYTSGLLDPQRVRFLHINPITGETRNTSLTEEMGKFAQAYIDADQGGRPA
jgi:hypothetical protein